MHVETIDPARTAIIVVDMHNDFVAAGAPIRTPAARAAGPKLVEALKINRGAGMRVIYHCLNLLNLNPAYISFRLPPRHTLPVTCSTRPGGRCSQYYGAMMQTYWIRLL